MTPRLTLKRHADLLDRMANATGVDLEQAMMEGRYEIDQLGEAVLACTGCSQPGDCQHWLEANEAKGTTQDPPTYCRNREDFLRLAQGKRV